MNKKAIGAGLCGGIVLFTWVFVTNAMLPFKSNLVHRVLPLQDQLEVHDALKENISEPGTYSIPYLSREEEEGFPDYRSQPVYAVIYEGYDHGGGGGGGVMTSAPVMLLAAFLPPLLAALMLSMASPAILSRYSRKFFFVMAIGVIIVLYDDVLQMSLGPQPKDYLYFLAINNLAAWAVTGLVIARIMKPKGVASSRPIG